MCVPVSRLCMVAYLVHSAVLAVLRKQREMIVSAKGAHVDGNTGLHVSILPFVCWDDAAPIFNDKDGLIKLRKKHKRLDNPYPVLLVLARVLTGIEDYYFILTNMDRGSGRDGQTAPCCVSTEVVLHFDWETLCWHLPRFVEYALRSIHFSRLAIGILE